jgi:hypothetical protein
MHIYLEEQLWSALHARARSEKTTISELVRQAVRERYFGGLERRAKAMFDFVGSRKAAAGAPDATSEIRALRRGVRIDRLSGR